MKLHLLVLLLIPIIHVQGRNFNLFNPLRGIIPSIQYVQVGGGDRDFKDDRRNNNFNQLSLPSTLLLTRWDTCQKRGGFYVDGECYLYVANPVSWAAAKSSCQGMGGNLWLPNLDNPFLYQEIVDATRDITPDFFSAPNERIWLGIQNTGATFDIDSLGNPITQSHLRRSTVGTNDCGVLEFFDTGAFFIDGPTCTGPLPYVCRLNI